MVGFTVRIMVSIVGVVVSIVPTVSDVLWWNSKFTISRIVALVSRNYVFILDV